MDLNGLWEQSGVFATDGIAAPEIFCSVEGFDYSDLVLLPRRGLDPLEKDWAKMKKAEAEEKRRIKTVAGGPVKVAQAPTVLPRSLPDGRTDVIMQTQLTRNLRSALPFVSLPADTVTGWQLAAATALAGGMGVLHGNCSIEEQVAEMMRVKEHVGGFIWEPRCCRPEDPVQAVWDSAADNGHSTLLVTTDGLVGSELLGIVTARDIGLEPKANDGSRPIRSVMTPYAKMTVAQEPISLSAAHELLAKCRKGKLPVVNARRELITLVTRADAIRLHHAPLASKEPSGKLRVAAAVPIPRPGTTEPPEKMPANESIPAPPEWLPERLEGAWARSMYLMQSGVDALVLDAPTGGASQPQLDLLTALKQDFPHLDVVAGNVMTPRQARVLLDAGADAIRVGAPDGTIVASDRPVGRAQASALWHVARLARERGVPVWADGGCDNATTAILALSLGANAVMLGSVLAGVNEAASAEVIMHPWSRAGRVFRGQGSLHAMHDGTAAMFGSATAPPPQFPQIQKHPLARRDPPMRVPLGPMEVVHAAGPAHRLFDQLGAELRQILGDLGVQDLAELQALVADGRLRYEVRATAEHEAVGPLRPRSDKMYMPYTQVALPFYSMYEFP